MLPHNYGGPAYVVKSSTENTLISYNIMTAYQKYIGFPFLAKTALMNSTKRLKVCDSIQQWVLKSV